MLHETKIGNRKNTKCDCIICAAGSSSRMGEWKPLLPWGQSTLVETSVDAALAAGCRVILVTGYRAEMLEELFRDTPNLVTVHNASWKAGMVSSIRCGAALVTSDCFFIAHADMPLVPPRMYGKLLAAARSALPASAGAQGVSTPRVLRPRFEGAPGHPVLFDRSALPIIASLPDGESMKEFLGQCELHFLDTDERGVTLDLDNPEIYAAELARADFERSARGILVITGEKGTGKTTRIGRVFDCAAERKVNAVLVRQTATGRDAQGRATGFDMELKSRYADGRTQGSVLPLARLASDGFDPVSRTALGPFVFDRAVFAEARIFVSDFIEHTGKQERFFGIDEIGKLELERSEGLMPVLKMISAAVRFARAEGLPQFAVCSARLDTLDKLASFMENEQMETYMQMLNTGYTEAAFSRRRFP